MHEWFSRPLRFGDPQPSWKDIHGDAKRTTPAPRCNHAIYDAASGSTFKSGQAFLDVMEDDCEYWLFAIGNMAGRPAPDFDHAITFLPGRRRREIEDEIEYLEQQIRELKRELGYGW